MKKVGHYVPSASPSAIYVFAQNMCGVASAASRQYAYVERNIQLINGPAYSSSTAVITEVEVEQGLTFHQTHYEFSLVKMTQPTVSKHWKKIDSKD